MIDLTHLDKTSLHQLNADYAQMERMGGVCPDNLLRQEVEKLHNENIINPSIGFQMTALLLCFEASRVLLYGKPRCP